MEPNPTSRLEEQVYALTARVYLLEQTLRKHGIELAAAEELKQTAAPPTPTPAQAAAAPAVVSEPQPIAPSLPSPQANYVPWPRVEHQAQPSSASAPIPVPERSLESRIGSQWFNRIGILAVLIGMASFLKLAIDNHWIGPLGRVLIGLIAGAALIAWSERFQRRGFLAFGYSLKAVGSGTLYLSLWAAFSLYSLIPASAAFAAMILITAFNGFLAWIQDAELLAFYAIAGGLSTPLLLSTHTNHETALFTYLLMLDLAALTLVIRRPWSRLLFATFLGTLLFFAGSWSDFYSAELRTPTAFFLTCFFLIFAAAPRLIPIETENNLPPSFWDSLVLVILPIGNAALSFCAYYALFDPLNHEWAGACLAVAMAAFYLLLRSVPQLGIWRPSPPLLSSLHLTLAIVFFTLAFPLEAHGRWLTIGWLAEGAALYWVGARQRSHLLRVFALFCLLLGLGALITINPEASATPIVNSRFGTYLVAIAAVAFIGWTAKYSHGEETPLNSNDWQVLASVSLLVGNALFLLALSLEIHYYWTSPDGLSNAFPASAGTYAQFSYSALFMLYGAALLASGFWRRSPFVRWQSLILLAVAIGKVFLVDISQLNQGYRILSFFGLGALLLAVSFVYQRDWLHLRASVDTRRQDG